MSIGTKCTRDNIDSILGISFLTSHKKFIISTSSVSTIATMECCQRLLSHESAFEDCHFQHSINRTAREKYEFFNFAIVESDSDSEK